MASNLRAWATELQTNLLQQIETEEARQTCLPAAMTLLVDLRDRLALVEKVIAACDSLES
jgi:hypothetical protein